ncbi:MAG TPA: MlaD family protein [Chthoniobacterales bacterium]|nr:MlaD family protein [Chthoniobacterales bacterium]
MQILRDEIRTGLLVILTIGLAVGIVLYLSAPGLFRPIAHYKVFFDDAAAIKPGSTVLLAGRQIGTVEYIQSPVPLAQRPPGNLDCEALVTVQVSADAQIYKANSVAMRTFGLLADLVIDFTNGDPNSGRAVSGDSFVGVRRPDLAEVGPVIIKKLDPVLREATSTLSELRRTSLNLTELTAKDSKLMGTLNGTLENFREVGGNLKTLTDKGGSVDSALSGVQTTLQGVQTTLRGVQDVTAQVNKDKSLEKTLANFNASSERLKLLLGELQGSLNTALPHLGGILTDLNELTDKLKTQPWRIIWPTTIKYPETPTPGRSAPKRARSTPTRSAP